MVWRCAEGGGWLYQTVDDEAARQEEKRRLVDVMKMRQKMRLRIE